MFMPRNLSRSSTNKPEEAEMERRDFLKLTVGFAAGAAALAASAQAAPLPPVMPPEGLAPPRGEGAQLAVVTQDDVDRLKPEEVRWGRRRWGFRRRRFFGFRRRRFWGGRRRHWRRRRWFW
jgi:hypothetical protein